MVQDRLSRQHLPNLLLKVQVMVQCKHDRTNAWLMPSKSQVEPDVESVAAHLARHRWNLPRALDDWFRNGFAVIKDKYGSTKTRMLPDKSRYPVPSDASVRPPSKQDLSAFCPEPAEYLKAKDYKGPKKPASQEEIGADRDVGYLLNDAGKPIKLGCENPNRLLKSYIHHGKLREKRFERRDDYFWPEIKGDSGNGNGQGGGTPPPAPSSGSNSSDDSDTTPKKPRVSFDWTKQVDIDRLNEFHRENNYRIKGTKKRTRAWPWTEEERKELVKLHEKEWPSVIQQYPDPKDPKRKIVFHKELGERWAGVFNGPKFKGKEFNGLTRNTDRKPPAINIQRGRMQELVDRFGVTRDEHWFADKEKKAAAKKEKEEKEAENRAKKEEVRRGNASDSSTRSYLTMDDYGVDQRRLTKILSFSYLHLKNMILG